MTQFRFRLTNISLSILLLGGITSTVLSQDHGQHQGQGHGRMGRIGMGGNQPQDMKTIHALFNNHKKISRTVKNIERGVETITESDDPKVRAMIAEHAWAMKRRLENKQPIRHWDPLFAELFKHADKINLQIIHTAKGVKVIETSEDAWVVKLIQFHIYPFIDLGASRQAQHRGYHFHVAARAGEQRN
ncbi:MAG: hypothetical protein MOB07_19735 [Acidobacteria bacterium]|nr:hypothetical protein [Acidobacteriota bacterium]